MVWLKRDLLTPLRKRTPTVNPVLPASEVERVFEGGTGKSDVLHGIRKMIKEGRFVPGSALPPERTLAAQFGVGRPAVREAIKALAGLGILESRRGSGTFVKALEPEAAHVPGLTLSGNAEFGTLEILEVRKILEPRAAWLAATRASARQLMEIENARQMLEAHDRDWKLVAKLDLDLHAAIFRGGQNPVLVLLHEFLMRQVLLDRGDKVRFSPDIERMRREHRAIVDSILKREAAAAEKAMIEHLHSVGLDYIAKGSR